MKEILSDKIDDGFAFPLNPKWILCDEGWKDLYDKLLASEAPNVQDAMNVWYPADVRERIAAISSKYPVRFGSSDRHEDYTSEGLGLKRLRRRSAQLDYEKFNAEIAELELERYKHARSGMKKLRKALLRTKKPKKKKTWKFNFYSISLLMIGIGKEADAQKKSSEVVHREKSGSKKLLNIMRLRSSVDSQTATTTTSIAPVTIERSASPQTNNTQKCSKVETEENIVKEKSGSKNLLNMIRRRSSVDSHDAASVIAPDSSVFSASSRADTEDTHDHRPSRRRSVTNFIRNRLSFRKDKGQSSTSM